MCIRDSGHAIAAAGIQEFHVLTTCMSNGLVPANLNCNNPIQTPLELPLQTNQNRKIKYALTNNFAFGGVNCALALENLAL
jgi:3-oxoacyl-(acyl-carrier-protein) synthase